jgi:hypothetical protein
MLTSHQMPHRLVLFSVVPPLLPLSCMSCNRSCHVVPNTSNRRPPSHSFLVFCFTQRRFENVYWSGSASGSPCVMEVLGNSTAGKLAWNGAPSSLRVYPGTSPSLASSAINPLRFYSSQGDAYYYIHTSARSRAA